MDNLKTLQNRLDDLTGQRRKLIEQSIRLEDELTELRGRDLLQELSEAETARKEALMFATAENAGQQKELSRVTGLTRQALDKARKASIEVEEAEAEHHATVCRESAKRRLQDAETAMLTACISYAAIYCVANSERPSSGRPDLIKKKLPHREFCNAVEVVFEELTK